MTISDLLAIICSTSDRQANYILPLGIQRCRILLNAVIKLAFYLTVSNILHNHLFVNSMTRIILEKEGYFLRKQHELTPFGKTVKIKLAVDDKTVTWLGDQIRALGITCYDEQISKCLRGTLHNQKILNAISQIMGVEREVA